MNSDSETHPYQASNLTGMWGGKLMCETRNEQRQQRADREDSGDKPSRPRRSRKQSPAMKPSSDEWSLSEKTDA